MRVRLIREVVAAVAQHVSQRDHLRRRPWPPNLSTEEHLWRHRHAEDDSASRTGAGSKMLRGRCYHRRVVSGRDGLYTDRGTQDFRIEGEDLTSGLEGLE